MTAAPPDVKALLDDLATQVPPFDVADAALRTAHRRRTRRYVVGATVSVLVALAVATLPVVDVHLPAGLDIAGRDETAGTSYEPDVVTPGSGVEEDLPPTLDEPISMVLSRTASEAPGGDDLVVTASGRVFRLAGSRWWTATVSPDGHVLVWYDATEHALVSRDLRDGTTHRYRPTNSHDSQGDRDQPMIVDRYPGVWSPDGTLLAMLADAPDSTGIIAIVLDVTDGTDRHFEIISDSAPYVDSLDWLDDDTLLVPRAGEGTTSFPITIVEVGLDGSAGVERETVRPPGGGQPFVISPARDALVSTSNLFPLIRRFDVATGRYEDLECRPCTGAALGTQWASEREVVVTPDGPTGDSPLVPRAVDIDTGATRPLAAISGRELPLQVIFARDLLLAGPAHEPHTSMWWPGWYLDWITYAAVGLVLLVIAYALLRFMRRRQPATPTGTPSPAPPR